MWHIFWRGYSRLRSGREHWAWMVVVEVRQGTLGGDGRGWGPAGNTGHGWSWLRSDREHCASRVAVEQEEEERRGGEERRRGEEERRGEEQATDIKSNNPHLAGGEKIVSWRWVRRHFDDWTSNNGSHLHHHDQCAPAPQSPPGTVTSTSSCQGFPPTALLSTPGCEGVWSSAGWPQQSPGGYQVLETSS